MKFAELNRKPLDYKKPYEMVDVLGLTEDNPAFGSTTAPVKLKKLWISEHSNNIGEGTPISANRGYSDNIPRRSAVAELGGEFAGVAVNLPTHMLPVVEDILNDGESLSMIARGHVGLAFYEYENQYGDQTGVLWVDL